MNAREKRIVLIGGGIVVAAVAWRGGVGEAVGRWGEARARLADEGERVADLGRRAQRRDALAGRIRQRMGPAAAGALPGVAVAEASFPSEVRAALEEAGLEVGSVSLQGVQRERDLPGVSLVRVLVEGTADGGSVPAVLAGTRAVPRATRVEELTLTKGDEGWGLRLTLSTPARRSGGDS